MATTTHGASSGKTVMPVERVPFVSAASLAERGLPCLVSGAPWPPVAARRWDPTTLAAMAPVLRPVRAARRAAHEAPVDFWNPDLGLEEMNNATNDWNWSGSGVEETELDTMHFFGPTDDERAYYYSGDLHVGSGEPHPDLLPMDTLMPLAANATPPMLKAWVGTAGATTPLHYDSQHNVYAQLVRFSSRLDALPAPTTPPHPPPGTPWATRCVVWHQAILAAPGRGARHPLHLPAVPSARALFAADRAART